MSLSKVFIRYSLELMKVDYYKLQTICNVQCQNTNVTTVLNASLHIE